MRNVFISVLLVLAISLAACDSGVPPTGQGDTPQVSDVGQDSVDEAAAGDENITDESGDDLPPIEENSTGDEVDASSFFADMGPVEYVVTYDFTSSNPEGEMSGQMVMAFKDDKGKTQVTSSGQITTSYFMDGNVYTCTDAGGQAMCFEVTPSQVQTNTFEQERGLRDDPDVEYRGMRQIAGVETTCFGHVTDSADVEYCYSPEYAPLYIRNEAEGSVTEMTATDYSPSVPDSEFELPAEPQELNMPTLD